MKCPYCEGTGQLGGDRAHVGALILTARQQKGWSQAELAGKVGLSRPQIANIEVGRSDLPVSRLKQFADAFGISMKDLVP